MVFELVILKGEFPDVEETGLRRMTEQEKSENQGVADRRSLFKIQGCRVLISFWEHLCAAIFQRPEENNEVWGRSFHKLCKFYKFPRKKLN